MESVENGGYEPGVVGWLGTIQGFCLPPILPRARLSVCWRAIGSVVLSRVSLRGVGVMLPVTSTAPESLLSLGYGELTAGAMDAGRACLPRGRFGGGEGREAGVDGSLGGQLEAAADVGVAQGGKMGRERGRKAVPSCVRWAGPAASGSSFEVGCDASSAPARIGKR